MFAGCSGTGIDVYDELVGVEVLRGSISEFTDDIEAALDRLRWCCGVSGCFIFVNTDNLDLVDVGFVGVANASGVPDLFGVLGNLRDSVDSFAARDFRRGFCAGTSSKLTKLEMLFVGDNNGVDAGDRLEGVPFNGVANVFSSLGPRYSDFLFSSCSLSLAGVLGLWWLASSNSLFDTPIFVKTFGVSELLEIISAGGSVLRLLSSSVLEFEFISESCLLFSMVVFVVSLDSVESLFKLENVFSMYSSGALISSIAKVIVLSLNNMNFLDWDY